MVYLAIIIILLTTILILSFKNKQRYKKEIAKIKESNETKAKNIKQKEIKDNQDQDKIEQKVFSKEIFFHPSFLNIKEKGIFKNYLSSENNNYMIAYNQSPEDNYTILEKKKVISYGKVPRLKEGRIANDGNFIISSWGFSTNSPGIFHAFNKNAELLFKRRFKANIYDIEISENGKFAICQTCKSEYDKYSNKLLFFDLENNDLLWITEAIADSTTGYDFNMENKELILNYKKQPSYRYSFKGEFLDKKKWQLYNPGVELTASEIFSIMEEKHKKNHKNLSKTELKNNLNIFKKLLNTDLTEIKYKHARTYRYIGEILLELNDRLNAVKNFEKALKISERVGVKRITKKLKKELLISGK